jgi:uridine kinase
MFRVFVILICVGMQSIFAQHVVVGIAGGTGSGKTTLAEKIQAAFPGRSVLISQDSYYKDLGHLPMSERDKANFDHPSSLDFEMLKRHLIDLKSGKPVKQPIYSFHTHSREKQTKVVEPADLIIVEGILLFAAAEVKDLFDIKIFVETDDDVRLMRRMERDIKERSRDFESVKMQYLATVKPMHDVFVEPSKQYADVIIPTRGHNQIALDLILSKLTADLER